MSLVHVTDSNGDTMELKLDNGRHMSPDFRDIASLASLTARTDDIILCSFSRSGTHWLWELISMALKGDLELQQKSKMACMLEFVGCEGLEKEPSPRVVNTHLRYNELPGDILNKKCKIIFLQRNPKDVAVSFYNFLFAMKCFKYDGKFDGFVGLFEDGKVPYDSWFEYTKGWDEAIKAGSPSPILVVSYEELKKNFTKTMSKIGTFIGVDRPCEFYSEMNMKTEFKKFKLRHDQNIPEGALGLWKDEPGFIRKGLTGDWKNWFTVAQSEHFDKVFDQHLQGINFRFDYN